jgi:Cu+-exporting ATPase
MTACPACAKEVDPLRAGHVAIFDDKFYYFCDRVCRERLAPLAALTAPVQIKSPRPSPARETWDDSVDASALRAERRGLANGVPRQAISREDERDGDADIAAPVSTGPPSLGALVRDAKKAAGPREAGVALTWASAAAGALAISLVLAGPAVMALRVSCAFLGWICLAIRAVRIAREPTDVHPALLLAPALGGCIVALSTWLFRDPAAEEAATFAGVVVTAAALAIQLVERARQPLAAERIRIAEALSAAPLRSDDRGASVSDGPSGAKGARVVVKAGDETTVQAGDVLPVDGSIVAGEALVIPWLGATESVKRREGESLLSGAQVITGKVRVRAAYIGLDRAWTRLTLDPRRRADVHARMARVARALASRGGFLALVLGGLAGIANGEAPAHIVMMAIAAWASLTTAAIGSMASVHVGRGILEGLRRGIAYRSPADWDKAGEVSIAAFCARGTLLLGEPELADLEALGKATEEQVLALVAGAESSSTHPVAMAIQRAAIARRVRPDAVRSPNVQPGLGVLAVASTGETLAVGSRSLMLKEKISIAIAEQKIAEIEAHGREVLLVSLASRLVGVLGLQDGLRPGARAAVQHLLDAQVEPVLISGDSRETCEAIGRALDIDHIRPEIPLGDRAIEIERLSQGGLTVAVLGHPRTDEAALSAAQVAVAMPTHGGASGEWGVMLASDDVRDGALAISLARRTRNDARTGLVMAVAPSILLALAVAFGLLPAAYAPLAALLGAAAAALHARATDLTRTATSQVAKSADSFGPDVLVSNKVH